MADLSSLIHESEERILELVMAGAVKSGYAAHMPATEEGFRRSVQNLVDSLDESLEAGEDLPLPSTDLPVDSPAFQCGEEAFAAHMARGAEPTHVYGSITLYRGAFLTAVHEIDSFETRERDTMQILRFFDLVLLGFVHGIGKLEADSIAEDTARWTRQLVAEKNRYTRAFEYLPLPMFFVDRDGLLESMNSAAEALFRPSSLDLARRFLSNSVRKPLPVLADEVAAFSGGPDREATFERELRTGKGRRHFEVRFAKLFDSSGAAVGILVILTDMTYRHHAEAALRASQAGYQALFNNLNLPWVHSRVVMDEENRPVDLEYLEVNRAYEEYAGRSAKDLVGRTISQVGPGFIAGADNMLQTLAHVARTGESAVVEAVTVNGGAPIKMAVYCPRPGHVAALAMALPPEPVDPARKGR